MVKLALIFIPILIIIALLVGVRFYTSGQNSAKTSLQALVNSSDTPADVSAELDSMENKIEVLRKQLIETSANSKNVATSSPKATTNPSIESRLATLEAAISEMQVKLNTLKPTQTTTTQTTTSTKSPTYISSTGVTSSSSNIDWTPVGNPSITIDPTDYPGYTSMQLEGVIKTSNSSGRSYARLYLLEDSSPIVNSEISTTAVGFTSVLSSPFFLPAGKKTYTFQLKAQSGYEASLQSARVKVNY